ncbi:hypothetical protein A9Z42_0082590 [Trichoderma parareesei]|uniref:FAD linked oxidase N-terminal domain-containing protein n=1 Tax=Trichoderma parareesei TaxID=858221 RepID=A0A2H3A864_TRIPA|nr:hypothetical protein A9Z42_0082590 [Trichoderma parareesei]
MRRVSIALLLFLQSVVTSSTHTLKEVKSQISSYMDQNGTDAGRFGPLPGCHLACGFLESVLARRVSYPQSPTYEFEESRYWSQQQELTKPTCRFSPASAEEISLAVLTFRVTNCKFAVKSGGHAAFAGASNVESGVTIDLIHLNQLALSADKTQASIGAGNMWYDVYAYLQPENVTVIGGRVSAIGVGAAYPQGDLWAGSETFLYTNETAAAINSAFYYLGINAPSDPYAQVIIAYAYAQSQDVFVIASDLQYAKPIPNPVALQNFTSVAGAIASTLRVVDLANLTVEFNNSNPGGFRQTYWTFTVQNSACLMTELVEIYLEEVASVKDIAGIVPSIVFQLITTDMSQYFSRDGGNPLGLDGQGPLNLVNIAISWSSAADDKRVMAAAQNIVDRSTTTACTQGLDHPYLYQNYASYQQDVFASYGKKNLRKLRSISARYDPQQVWQQLQPGYFKLWRLG